MMMEAEHDALAGTSGSTVSWEMTEAELDTLVGKCTNAAPTNAEYKAMTAALRETKGRRQPSRLRQCTNSLGIAMRQPKEGHQNT